MDEVDKVNVHELQFLLQQSVEVGQQQWLLLCGLSGLNTMRRHSCLNIILERIM